MMNLFSRVPFFISILPCFTIPESLNLYPGRVECMRKKLGVIDLLSSTALLAWRKVPIVRIKLP
jgi:hypothetical protein